MLSAVELFLGLGFYPTDNPSGQKSHLDREKTTSSISFGILPPIWFYTIISEMSACAGGVRIARRAGRKMGVPVSDLPLFLCPGFIAKSQARCQHRQPYTTSTQTLLSTPRSVNLLETAKSSNSASLITKLPLQCSGCGALSQVIDKDEAGYYNVKRKSVDEYLRGASSPEKLEEDTIVEKSLQAAADLDPGILAQLGFRSKEAKPGREDILSMEYSKG